MRRGESAHNSDPFGGIRIRRLPNRVVGHDVPTPQAGHMPKGLAWGREFIFPADPLLSGVPDSHGTLQLRRDRGLQAREFPVVRGLWNGEGDGVLAAGGVGCLPCCVSCRPARNAASRNCLARSRRSSMNPRPPASRGSNHRAGARTCPRVIQEDVEIQLGRGLLRLDWTNLDG